MKLPERHQTVMPYLILPGASAFIDFAKNVFGAEEFTRYPTDDGKVMHAEIAIGTSTIMTGDSNEKWQPRPASLYIYSKDVDADYAKALKFGAKSIMEPNDQPYGRTCGVEDPTGNVWWITSLPKS